MEIILLQDVKSLGKEGDTVKVKDGYARNFLIPKKLAVPAGAGALKDLEIKKKKAAKEKERERKTAEELADKLGQLSLNIPMEAGPNDALFGSVTSEIISEALEREGVSGIDKRDVTLPEPIKKLGVYTAEIKLHPEIKAGLRIWVIRK